MGDKLSKINSKNKDYNSIIEGLKMSFIGLSVGFVFEPYFSLFGNSTIIIWLLIGITYKLKLSKVEFREKGN